jgi:hypothetical protein
MDMSVPVDSASDSLHDVHKGDTAVQVLRSSNSSDLDAWLEKVEALGELKRISAEIDPDLEAATLTYLVGNEKSPALLFENIKGHPGHKALYNMVQPVALLPDDRREAARSSAQGGAGAGSPAPQQITLR